MGIVRTSPLAGTRERVSLSPKMRRRFQDRIGNSARAVLPLRSPHCAFSLSVQAIEPEAFERRQHSPMFGHDHAEYSDTMKRVNPRERQALRRRLRVLIKATLAELAVRQRRPDSETGRYPGRRGPSDSDAAFAEHVDIPRQTVSHWLTGAGEPSLPQVVQIAARTGVSLDWLLAGAGGDQPVYRGASKSPGDLADEVAAHVRRRLETAQAAGEINVPESTQFRSIMEMLGSPVRLASEATWEVDGAVILRDATEREVQAQQQWSRAALANADAAHAALKIESALYRLANASSDGDAGDVPHALEALAQAAHRALPIVKAVARGFEDAAGRTGVRSAAKRRSDGHPL